MKTHILKNRNTLWNLIEFTLTWKNFSDSHCFALLGIEKLFADFFDKNEQLQYFLYKLLPNNLHSTVCDLHTNRYIYLYLEYIDKNLKGLVWLTYTSCLIYAGVLHV